MHVYTHWRGEGAPEDMQQRVALLAKRGQKLAVQ